MQLPNKLYSFQESTLALIPEVLKNVQRGPINVMELYMRVRPSLSDATDFLSVLDCLYALRAVGINDKGEVYYARRNDVSGI